MASVVAGITWRGVGKIPPNAIKFEIGQAIGEHVIVQRVGSWSGSARWQLRCPAGHFFERSANDIRRAQRGLKGQITCRECRALRLKPISSS